jgi:hypothetical protein
MTRTPATNRAPDTAGSLNQATSSKRARLAKASSRGVAAVHYPDRRLAADEVRTYPTAGTGSVMILPALPSAAAARLRTDTKFGSHVGEALAACPAPVYAQVLAVAPAGCGEAVPQNGRKHLPEGVARTIAREHTEVGYPIVLLRPSRERPHTCRSDSYDEIASPHCLPPKRPRTTPTMAFNDEITAGIYGWRNRSFCPAKNLTC